MFSFFSLFFLCIFYFISPFPSEFVFAFTIVIDIFKHTQTTFVLPSLVLDRGGTTPDRPGSQTGGSLGLKEQMAVVICTILYKSQLVQFWVVWQL